MLETIFMQVLNLSITTSYLAIAVIMLRLLLKKAPKWIMGILWGFVTLRLVMPFPLESALSLIPSAHTIHADTFTAVPYINSGFPALNSTVNPMLIEAFTPDPAASANPIQIILPIVSAIWLIGIAIMLLYTLFSFIHIKRSVRESVKLNDNIWVCDGVSTPFILGVIKPKIYLPSNMNDNDMTHVIAHEKAHLKRRDHIVKPLGFLLLSVYWFNPILWLAYILMCRDIELACDEKVLKEANADIKKAYSNALINCSAPKKIISACPVAFGETGIKSRIKNVLSYKKPAFWVIIVAIIACIITAVCLLTNPLSSTRFDDGVYDINTDVCLSNGEYSYALSIQASPWQAIFNNNNMKIIVGEETSWANNFRRSRLEHGIFDNDFWGYTHGNEKLSVSSLVLNNKTTYKFDYAADDNYPFKPYYLMEQRNGDIYLVYCDIENGEAKNMRWVLKLENHDNIAIIGGIDGPIGIKTSEE